MGSVIPIKIAGKTKMGEFLSCTEDLAFAEIDKPAGQIDFH